LDAAAMLPPQIGLGSRVTTWTTAQQILKQEGHEASKLPVTAGTLTWDRLNSEAHLSEK
jgi:hypothetical protein